MCAETSTCVLYMCPHTTLPPHVSSYYSASSYYYYMCPHTSVCMRPDTRRRTCCGARSALLRLVSSALLYSVPAGEHSVELIEDNSVDRALQKPRVKSCVHTEERERAREKIE